MTARKHLKQLVRERQAKTGERYTTALAHIRGKARTRVPEEALPEATRWARLEGLHCKVFVTGQLWRSERSQVAPGQRFRALFARLRSLLQAVEGEPGTEALCAAVLRGEPRLGSIPRDIHEVAELRRFVSQVQAGVRGVSHNGRVVAFDVARGGAKVTIFAFCLLPMASFGKHREPLLWLFSRDEFKDSVLDGQRLVWAFALSGIGSAERGTP